MPIFYDFMRGVQIRGTFSGVLKPLKNDRAILLELPILFAWLLEYKIDCRDLLAFPVQFSRTCEHWPEDVGRTPMLYEKRVFFVMNPEYGVKGAYRLHGNRTWIEQFDFVDYEQLRPLVEGEDEWLGELDIDFMRRADKTDFRSFLKSSQKVVDNNKHLRIDDGTEHGRALTYEDIGSIISEKFRSGDSPYKLINTEEAKK